MRNLLTLLNLSMLVLLVGIPDGDVRVWLALVGAVTAVLLWRMAQHERRAECQQAGDQAIDLFLAAAASARGTQAGTPARHQALRQSESDGEG